MRTLLLAGTIACLLVFTSAAHATTRTVYVVDHSKYLPVSQLENALPAFQAAVSQDFAPAWGQDARLVLTGTPPPDGWTINVTDTSDLAGALGYHSFDGLHVWADVAAKDSVDNDTSWQGCFTHELFEMLADPYTDRLALGKRLWLVEVADPVEADAYNYARPAADGSLVPISDFVLPAWYRKTAPRGTRFDFKGHVKHPGVLLPGGYVSYWGGDNHWHQLFG